MIPWNKLNYEERERIETLFDSGEGYKIEVFSEEPRIEFDDGTIIYIEGVQE